jgi:hypothetical protein
MTVGMASSMRAMSGERYREGRWQQRRVQGLV